MASKRCHDGISMSKQVMFRWRSFAAFWFAFSLAGLGWLAFKRLQLEHLTGLKVLARVLNRPEGAFSTWELMGLYGADVGIGLLLIPLLAGLLAAQQRFKVARPLLVVLLLAYMLLLHADMAAFANVTTMLSWEMIREAAAWAQDDPEIIQYYVTPRTWLKIAGTTAGLILLLLWLDRGRWRQPASLSRAVVLRTVGALVAGLAIVALCGLMQPLSAYPQSSAALARALSAMMPDPQRNQYLGRSQAQLQEDFCQLVGVPCHAASAPADTPAAAASAPARTAPQAPRDVILFIMETGPADFYDLPGLMAGDPLLRNWARHAWFAQRHYATYPYTSDATFSLLSGLYPEGRRQWLKCRDSQPLGWVETLRSAGYATRHYAPSPDSFEADGLMFQRVGLRDRYIAEADEAGREAATAQLDALRRRVFPQATQPLSAKAVLDQQSLGHLLADMAAWQRQSKPYVAVFAPQIGHGPWPDLLQRSTPVPLKERARLLGALQMAWLHEIVAQLKQAGRLEHTLVIVTADHGLRTQAEYPDIPAGWLTGVSSRVPLMIQDGGRPLPFDERRVSSHVDVGPTVLQRLGLKDPQRYVEGLPLSDPALAQRRTYIQGVGYLGAELMHHQGRFIAHAPMRKACMQSGTDDMSNGDVLPYARCQEAFEPFKAAHQEAMKRLCQP